MLGIPFSVRDIIGESESIMTLNDALEWIYALRSAMNYLVTSLGIVLCRVRGFGLLYPKSTDLDLSLDTLSKLLEWTSRLLPPGNSCQSVSSRGF